MTRLGPWYGDGEESHRSCRHLRERVTEFGPRAASSGGVLLAWGTDLVWDGDAWSKARIDAYRVLLTRGRDGAVVFVP